MMNFHVTPKCSLSSHCCPCIVTSLPLPAGLAAPDLFSVNIIFSSISYKWNNTACDVLRLLRSAQCIWVSSKSLNVSVVHSFSCWKILYCMVVPNFVYSFTCWRTFDLFPVLDNYDQSCHKNSCLSFDMKINFHSSRVNILRVQFF